MIDQYQHDRQVIKMIEVKRALISVSDKKGIVDFARTLEKAEAEIISTGGTYAKLSEAGIKVKKVDELTGFPEMMEGRVKTLHPMVHGGILADRNKKEHMDEIDAAGILPIDMVVVNLYPFKETISKPDVTLEEAIENIDIGGPTMIRSAAKNNGSVAVIVDPGDYGKISRELEKNSGKLSGDTLFSLAAKAFQHTCEYDSVIFEYLGKRTSQYKDGTFSQNLDLRFEKIQDLRYGENPHQKAAYYRSPLAGKDTLVNAVQLQGKELSYNNILDTNAAFFIVKEFAEPCVSVIKHNNPCGASVGNSIAEAYQRAYECDPVSAFGSVVASNMKWTKEAAALLSDNYVEVLIAPDFDRKALEIHLEKPNLRILKIDFDLKKNINRIKSDDFVLDKIDLKSIDGGIIMQDLDEGADDRNQMKVVTKIQPTEAQWKDLLFGWQIVKNVKSNAIVLAAHGSTVGVGVGQMSRIDAARLAVNKSSGRCKGSIMASDAFFPFRDVAELAAQNGILAIIQPGGSVNDEETVETCDKYRIPMVFTGKRHFKH